MLKRLPSWAAAATAAEAAAVALFLAIVRQSAGFTIVDHSLRLSRPFLIPFLGLAAAVFTGLIVFLIAQARREADAFASPYDERLKQGALAAAPLLAFFLSPFILADYLDRFDLRLRLVLLAAFVVISVLYLKISDWKSQTPKRTLLPQSVWRKFVALPVKRRLLLLGGGAFLVYAACAFLIVREGVTFTGDEPYYLLNSHSLVYDRDVNLYNNYNHRDYFHFYSQKENPHLRLFPYTREGKKGIGYLYPINLPGVSVLMVPFYALSQAVEEGFWRTFILKGSLIIWAVLLGLQVYLLARDLWKREGLAIGLWAVYGFSAPVLFYAIHLYPEIPIALFSVYVFRMARSGRGLRPRRLVFMGLLLGTFFWFGLKYNLVFWPLLAVAVYHLWRSQPRRGDILWLAAPALLGAGVFYFAVWSIYGTLSPFAVYEGSISAAQSKAIAQSFLDLPHIARVETFLDYFLDQRDGLLLYAPFYLFAALGLVEMLRKARKDLVALLLIGGPFVLNYAFFTHRQGTCPQARVLTPISWIGALAVGYFLARRGRDIFRWLFGLAAAAGFGIAGLLVAFPSFLYQPTTHEYTRRAGDLFLHLSNIRLFLPRLLPSFIRGDNGGYLPDIIWPVLVVLFIGAFVLFGKTRQAPFHRTFHFAATAVLLGGSIFLWVLHPRTALSESRAVEYPNRAALGFYMGPLGPGVAERGEGRLYFHFAGTYRIFFASRTPLKIIRLRLGSEKGAFSARLMLFDRPLDVVRTNGEFRHFIFQPPTSYGWRGFHLYEIRLALIHESGEFMPETPYLVQITPWDR